MKTNDARIVLMTAMSGHFEVSGRFATLEEVALIQAFALDVAGLNRGGDAPDAAARLPRSSAPALRAGLRHRNLHRASRSS
jgi:hypothetical protein